jgi:hypothetical protein
MPSRISHLAHASLIAFTANLRVDTDGDYDIDVT